MIQVVGAAWVLLFLIVAALPPIARSDANGDSNATDSRRMLSEVRYTFGISTSTKNSTACTWCADAKAGLEYWRSFVNTMGHFVSVDGKRIYVEIEAEEDGSNVDKMKENYKKLATWNQRRSLMNSEEQAQTPIMLALFGPFYQAWNLEASKIASDYNMVIINWAFEDGNYHTFPGPERPSMIKSARVLLENAVSKQFVSAFDGDGDDRADESMRTRQPEDTESQSALSRELQPTLTSKMPEFGSAHYDDLKELNHPCAEEQYNVYLISINVCQPTIEERDFYKDVEVLDAGRDDLSATKVLAVPKGTEYIAVKAADAPGQDVATSIRGAGAIMIWDLDETEWTPEEELRAFWGGEDRVPVCIATTRKDKDIKCRHEHEHPGNHVYKDKRGRSMDFNLKKGTNGMVEFYTEQTTMNLAFTLVQQGDGASVKARFRVQYTRIDPCPLLPIGCKPCGTWTGCKKPLYPACDGSRQVKCSSEPNPNGEVWDYGFTNVLDLNLLTTSWTLDAINQAYAHGARKFTFVDMSTAVTGDLTWSRQCQSLHQYCRSLNGTTDNNWPKKYTIKEQITLARDFRVMRADDADVFVHCGRVVSMMIFAMGAKAFGLRSKSYIADRPFGYSLISSTKGFNVNYFMEPLAMKYNISKDCAVFGDYNTFVEGFEQNKRFYGGELGYATMQTAAAGVLVTEAIQRLPVASLTTQDGLIVKTQKLVKHLKSTTTRTFFGDLSFNQAGQRQSKEASTRQFTPMNVGTTASTGADVKRYDTSDIAVVDDAIAPNFGYSPGWYDGIGWIRKELEVYPCSPGCLYHNKKCQPCAIGTYRSSKDIDCRPCRSGTYADVEGLAKCRPCSVGSVCDRFSANANEFHYPMSVAGNQTGADDEIYFAASGKECVNPNRNLNETVYEACRPISVCKGGVETCVGTNTGLLCGQCVDGESSSGPMSGRRLCKKCFAKHIVAGLGIGIIVLYCVVGKVLAQCALISASKTGSLSCVLLRTLIHFIHALGIVTEATRIDSSTSFAAFAIPFEVFIRPLTFAGVDCLRPSPSSLYAVQDIGTAAGSLLVLALIVIAASRVLTDVLRISLLIFKFILKWCKKCFGHRRQEDESDTDATSKESVDAGGSVPADSQDARPDGMEVVIGKDALSDQASEAAKSEKSQGKKKAQRDHEQEFSLVFGPGRRFSSMHEYHGMQEQLRIFFREVIVGLILLYPVVIRGLLIANACAELEGFEEGQGKRLIMNFDIICGSDDHKGVAGSSWVLFMCIFIGVPAVLALLLFVLKEDIFNLEWRPILQPLIDGYKPERANWEVVVFLRNGFLIWASALPQFSARTLLLLMIMLIYMCLLIYCRPYEDKDRFVLHHLDVLGSLSVIVTVVVGIMCQFEIDPELSGNIDLSALVKNSLMLVAMLINTLTVLYGLVALTTNAIALKIRIILRDSALGVDSNSKRFDWLVRKVWKGMNPVGYFAGNGRHFIDVSKLDEGEREFLVLSLIETMNACFDSGSTIHTWLLENAIHEGFNRAKEARNALRRSLYENHGSSGFHMLNFFGLLRLFRVSVRPPDIPAPTEEDKENAARKIKSQKVAGGAQNDKMQESDRYEGITVEELHNALSTVNVDILEHHPAMHSPLLTNSKAKPKAAKYYKGKFSHPSLQDGHAHEMTLALSSSTAGVWTALGKTEEVSLARVGEDIVITEKTGTNPLRLRGNLDQGGVFRGETFITALGGGRYMLAPEMQETEQKPDHEVLIWHHGASLGFFEDYAMTWGSLDIHKRYMPEKETKQPDDAIWDSMVKEIEDYKGSTVDAVKERQLAELHAMQLEEIRMLKLMALEAEAADLGGMNTLKMDEISQILDIGKREDTDSSEERLISMRNASPHIPPGSSSRTSEKLQRKNMEQKASLSETAVRASSAQSLAGPSENTVEQKASLSGTAVRASSAQSLADPNEVTAEQKALLGVQGPSTESANAPVPPVTPRGSL